MQWINQYFSGSSKRLGKYCTKFWERWFAELMRNRDFAWYLPLSKKSEKKLWRHDSNQSTQFLVQAIRQVKSIKQKFYQGNSPSSLNITTSKNGISHKKMLVFSFVLYYKHVMHYVIWYHLYNLKSVKNTHGGVLLLVNFLAKNLQLY